MTARRWREAITVTAILFFLAGIACTLLFVSAAGSCAHWAGQAERVARPALFVEVR